MRKNKELCLENETKIKQTFIESLRHFLRAYVITNSNK